VKRPRIEEIADRLEVSIPQAASPRRLRDVVEGELSTFFGVPMLEAAERAEQLEPRLAQMIARRQEECERAGTLAALVVLGSSFNMVAGACHVLTTDSEAVAQAKASRANVVPLLGRMQSLTADEFELFGAKVLVEIGAQQVRVTPRSNDQGIDFYGTLNIGKLTNAPEPFFRLAHDIAIQIAGQAKNYPNKAVSTNAIRELVGAIALARYKAFSTDVDLFEDLELKPFNPLVALLFTTGRLTSGAQLLAEKSGVIARSGHQLAVFLADRGVGMIAVGGGSSFDPAAFDAWLKA
jgi:hypothetical protein